ncbi:MAG: tRNA epoxyqueuosine(34) reductase QueG [Acidobacteriota bacterium]
MMRQEQLARWVSEAGFARAGVVPAIPLVEFPAYQQWVQRGLAGAMAYLTDHRAELREDPRRLLEEARSIVCVARSYHGPQAYSTEFTGAECAWISRYAWGQDYHGVMRQGLEQVAERLAVEWGTHQWRVCVDTAPLLERSYARLAGLGWIGRNQCLIDELSGSWFFVGFLLTSHELAPDMPPPDRCGTCRRCIDACPTAALVPNVKAPGGWELDARLCISYLTIELRGSIPVDLREGVGRHVYGCDICQDVCPWNEKLLRFPQAAGGQEFAPRDGLVAPRLYRLAALTPQEFQAMFRGTPVTRARYHGFLRNVAVAMGNSGMESMRESLERLALHDNEVVAEHAQWGLGQLAMRRLVK